MNPSKGLRRSFLLRGALRLLLCIGFIIALGAGTAAANEKIQVTVGQSVTHDVDQKIKTVSIANSQIADVVVAGPRQILLNGKAVGFTTVVVWDEHDRSSVYDVVVRGAFSDQQIELRVNVAEINRTRARELGVDFLIDDDHETFEGSHNTLGSYESPWGFDSPLAHQRRSDA